MGRYERYDVATHIKLREILTKKPAEWTSETPNIKDWKKVLIHWESCSEEGEDKGYGPRHWNAILKDTEVCSGAKVFDRITRILIDHNPFINIVPDRERGIDRGIPQSFGVEYGKSRFRRRPYLRLIVFYPRRFRKHIGLNPANQIIT